MSDDTRDPYNVECGTRLRRAREALGHTRSAFARITLAEDDDALTIKRAADRLEKWENGSNRVPAWYVRKVRPQFGIDMNYVFEGDMSALPGDLRMKIIERERSEAGAA